MLRNEVENRVHLSPAKFRDMANAVHGRPRVHRGPPLAVAIERTIYVGIRNSTAIQQCSEVSENAGPPTTTVGRRTGNPRRDTGTDRIWAASRGQGERYRLWTLVVLRGVNSLLGRIHGIATPGYKSRGQTAWIRASFLTIPG